MNPCYGKPFRHRKNVHQFWGRHSDIGKTCPGFGACTKVYDSVANWEKGSGTVIGEWMGTFDVMDADMAAAYDAFALQSGDLTWSSFDPESDATIPAFRAFLSSSRIDMTAHQARYE